jgi:hypothetical protein
MESSTNVVNLSQSPGATSAAVGAYIEYLSTGRIGTGIRFVAKKKEMGDSLPTTCVIRTLQGFLARNLREILWNGELA